MSTITALTPHVGVEVVGVSGHGFVSADVAAKNVCAPPASTASSSIAMRYIDDDDLIELSRSMGEVAVVPTGEHVRPEIQTITSDPGRTNPVMAAIRRGNFFWHFDGATEIVPQKGTFLAARDVDDPGEGGTQFASTYVAYESLSDDDKSVDRRPAGRAQLRRGARPRPIPTHPRMQRTMWDRVPTRVHPLVWSRRDGRKSMLLGATAGQIVGWPARREQGVARSSGGLGDATRLRRCTTTGASVIWSPGTTPACSTGRCRSSRPRHG